MALRSGDHDSARVPSVLRERPKPTLLALLPDANSREFRINITLAFPISVRLCGGGNACARRAFSKLDPLLFSAIGRDGKRLSLR